MRAPGSEEISRQFGDRVRTLRERTGTTLDQLAARSGVSRAMLSKVERGEKSPTIGLALRISHAVGGSLSGLLRGEQARSAYLVRRKEERESFKDEATGLDRQIISPTVEGSAVELLKHVLPASSSTGPLPPYPPGTEKYVMVETGSVTVRLKDAEVDLDAGDLLFFEADVEHCFENRGRKPCAYILIVSRCLLPATAP